MQGLRTENKIKIAREQTIREQGQKTARGQTIRIITGKWEAMHGVDEYL